MNENTPAPGDTGPAVPGPSATPPPSIVAQQEVRAQRVLLLALRLAYLVLLVTVTLLPFVGAITDMPEARAWWWYVVPFLATFVFGVLVIVLDTATPNKRLATVFGVYLGIVAGLVGALAIGALLDLIAESWRLTRAPWPAYLGLVKLAIGITLCYMAVSIVLTTKDDLRLVIPYVEFAKQVRGSRPMLLDTSVLIDGRIDGIGAAGFIEAPLVVPQFVIDELQQLSDSGDRIKRARGRRGLNLVSTLQTNPRVDVTIDAPEVTGHSVDHKLLQLARDQGLGIVTTDYNLIKVARIQGVATLNINDLATAVQTVVVPGDSLEVEVVKTGESPGQGVGYLPDGTMVVIENADGRVGDVVTVTVTNALQTAAGRMVFSRLDDGDDDDSPDETAGQMARAATGQPRATERPARRTTRSKRNPRR